MCALSGVPESSAGVVGCVVRTPTRRPPAAAAAVILVDTSVNAFFYSTASLRLNADRPHVAPLAHARRGERQRQPGPRGQPAAILYIQVRRRAPESPGWGGASARVA